MEILEQGQGQLIQPVDIDGLRAWNRAKTKALVDKRMSEAQAVSRFVHNGIYLGAELYGMVRCPLSLIAEIIRQGISDLRVAGQGVLELDMLLAAGRVRAMDISYAGLEAYGLSACLRREIESGRLEQCVEWSNAALAWRLKAAAMGVPFLPARSMLSTDTLRHSAAVVVTDPFSDTPVCLLPALILDVGLIHVHRADQYGNAQIDGISGYAAELARASKTLIISAEEIVETEQIRQQPDRTIIPYYLVDAVVPAPFGAHPGEMSGFYRRDEAQIRAWVQAAKTAEGAQAYLQEYIFNLEGHQPYLEKIGRAKLEELRSGCNHA